MKNRGLLVRDRCKVRFVEIGPGRLKREIFGKS